MYTTSQIQKQLIDLLQKALCDGQIQFKSNDGQVFVIRPLPPAKVSKASPLDVKGINLPVTTNEILLAVRESRQRYG
ncbi:MAG: type II toxin-antitoxin system Phd/YefM family antitoxin [Anaerolineales bacterium]|nr:type II toxin-antitoxin system Phd/YefM family antitoxin [Anaerolineales bacterium]